MAETHDSKVRKGICVAGNLIVDILYPISNWPNQGELVTVTEGIKSTTGGLACNVVMDLAKLDSSLPLAAVGIIGDDAEGCFIMETLSCFSNIDRSRILKDGKTSFTIVMSNNQTKERTFFQYRGSNAVFCESCIDWESIDAELLHIGYILLLDALDQEDDDYGTKMARLLRHAQQLGIKTSIDVVSETGNRFKRLVTPALKYTDFCIINEIEAQQVTGIPLRDNRNALLSGNMKAALQEMHRLGVSAWAVIHCPEGGYGLDHNGEYVQRCSLRLPDGYIKGTVGAGDAFCAGVLYGAQNKMPLAQSIELGIATAACSLSEADASSGVRSVQETMAFYNQMRQN